MRFSFRKNMKILFISLGCDKNLVDTEMMLGMLAESGHTFTDDESEAEAAVVNTCCFIGDAKEESINTILEMAELKKSGQLKALIVAGCLAQRYKEEIQTEIPEVDEILGTMAIDSVVAAIEEVCGGKSNNHITDPDAALVYGKHRSVTTGGHFAYLKIAEGCDKRCTYCIIPKVRGSFRSVPMDVLVKEASELAEGGVKELILVAQETTVYGKDLYGEKSLPRLLRELCRIPGIEWIRLLYCYPEEITDDLIETIKTEPKICHYLDMPIQHASDRILRQMGRRTNQAELRERIGRLREEIPDICLRTTLISGFPGECQEDHEELYNFVDELEFDRLGVFTYSQEEGTAAAQMENQVPQEIKEERQAELMELQQEIAFEKAENMKGRCLPAMVEGKVDGENAYVARTYKDAPNVDGLLFINTSRDLMTGDFVNVRITGSYEYDLIESWKMNLPNKLTILRMIMIIPFVVFMLVPIGGGAAKWIALALFVVASLTDLLDGKIARKYNLVTTFGKFMDPLADKLLVCAALICLVEMGKIPAWIVIIIVSREFIISGFRLVASDKGVVIAAGYWGKFKTTFQMVMIVLMIADIPALSLVTSIVMWAALILTVVSLADYLIKNKDCLADQK